MVQSVNTKNATIDSLKVFEEMSWSRLALPYGCVPPWLRMDTLHPAVEDPTKFPFGWHFYLGDCIWL